LRTAASRNAHGSVQAEAVEIGAEAAFAVAELHLQAAATGPRIRRAGGGSECLLPLRRGSMDLEQDVGVFGVEVVELAELPEQAQHGVLRLPPFCEQPNEVRKVLQVQEDVRPLLRVLSDNYSWALTTTRSVHPGTSG
jgi:hypothetical protein